MRFLSQRLRHALSEHANTLNVLVVLSGLIAGYGLYVSEAKLAQTARAHYVQTAHQAAVKVSIDVTAALRSVYRALRTIARLPSVQSLDRHANNLSDDARHAMREMYLNLADSIDVSEVYVVPRGFDPQAVDPATGRVQQPSITFDDSIVGRHAGTDAQRVEEIEIHEYRLMQQQIRYFVARYPTLDSIIGLGYPGVGGAEVVTCDNRRYSPQEPDDKDRSGYVYSVPFYGPGGRLRGIVSAALLTSSIARLLPNGDYALHNRAHSYTIPGLGDGHARQSLQWVERNAPNPNVVYSEILPLPIAEFGGGWVLWAGRTDPGPGTAGSLQRNRWLVRTGYVAIAMIALVLIAFIRSKAAETRVLEREVAERTRELASANKELHRSRERERQFTGDAAHELRTPITAMSALAQAAMNSDNLADRNRWLDQIRMAVTRAGRLIEQLLALARLDPLTPHNATQARINFVMTARQVMIETFDSAERKHVRISLDAPEGAWVIGETDMLAMLMRNLLDNAVGYAPESGNVDVTIDISVLHVSVHVDDDGCGIPVEYRPFVLQRFYRTPGNTEEGSGLGLSIVSRIADLHGAAISIATPPSGHGTRITVVFQRVAEPVQSVLINSRS
jgi:signal transduction histidine kinase